MDVTTYLILIFVYICVYVAMCMYVHINQVVPSNGKFQKLSFIPAHDTLKLLLNDGNLNGYDRSRFILIAMTDCKMRHSLLITLGLQPLIGLTHLKSANNDKTARAMTYNLIYEFTSKDSKPAKNIHFLQ